MVRSRLKELGINGGLFGLVLADVPDVVWVWVGSPVGTSIIIPFL